MLADVNDEEVDKCQLEKFILFSLITPITSLGLFAGMNPFGQSL